MPAWRYRDKTVCNLRIFFLVFALVILLGEAQADWNTSNATSWPNVTYSNTLVDRYGDIILDFASNTTDQSNIYTGSAYNNININQGVGQSFVAGTGGYLFSLRAPIYKVGTPTAPLLIKLYNTSGGNTPVGAALISESFPVSYVSTETGFMVYNFTFPVKLVAEHKYAITAESTTPDDVNNNYRWRATGTNTGYANGVVIYSDSTPTWYTTGYDNPFDIRVGVHYSAGFITTYHNASDGNVTSRVSINFSSIPSGTNHTGYSRQNQTGNYVLLGSQNATVNQSVILSTEYQDTQVQVYLFGGSATPSLLSIRFHTTSVISGEYSFSGASVSDEKIFKCQPTTITATFSNFANITGVNLSLFTIRTGLTEIYAMSDAGGGVWTYVYGNDNQTVFGNKTVSFVVYTVNGPATEEVTTNYVFVYSDECTGSDIVAISIGIGNYTNRLGESDPEFLDWFMLPYIEFFGNMFYLLFLFVVCVVVYMKTQKVFAPVSVGLFGLFGIFTAGLMPDNLKPLIMLLFGVGIAAILYRVFKS